MPHAPDDPKVKAAYADLLRQTRAQYDALEAAGYTFTFFDSKTDPYDGNPWNSMRDLRANQRMAVYGTYDGYGTEGITQGAVDDNPMLADTGLRWKDQGGEEHVVTGNDLFRAVHDAYGHGLEGAGFRADGEENAWQSHVRLFTGDAIGAITSETRGQNSWLNFGPYGEKNRTAKLEDTVFADQKTGLMPEWTWSEGKVADEQPRDEQGRFVSQSKARTDTPQFKRWFGDSKVVDADGEPLVVYHGTTKNFNKFKGALSWFSEGSGLAALYSMGDYSYKKGSHIVPAYLAIGTPLDLVELGITADTYISRAEFTKRTGVDMGADVVKVPASDIIHAPAFSKAATAAGFDGVKVTEYDSSSDAARHGRDAVTWAAFRPEQIKSAIGNDGSFDPANPDITMSRSRSNVMPTWTAPDDNRLDRFTFEVQDSRIDLKRIQESIAAAGGTIAEPFDARLAETNYIGRAANRTDVFLKSEYEPLKRAMAAFKVGQTELGDYLLARHAPERNAQIRKVNPALPDGGAGSNSHGTLMTDKAARQYLATIPVNRRTQLAALAARVDAITAGTRQILVAEGLEKQATITAWERAYPNYVPLFKDEVAEGAPHPIGAGFSVRGSASKRATGSTEEVTDVLAHVLLQREAAITRAEKNRVGMSLYGMALTNPNPDFWTVIHPGMSAKKIRAELTAMGLPPNAWANMDPAPTIRDIDKTTGVVVDRPNPLYKGLPGAVVLRVNGEDRVLMFNERNQRALRLALDMKNLDGLLHTEVVAKTIGRATRWFAAVNTQYNPAFGMVNFSRDVMAGTVNLTNTPLRRQKTKVLANVPAALVGIARDLRGDAARTPWSDTWNEFQAAGGQTGYRELFRTADERARKIEKELKAEGRTTPGKAAHAVLDLLDDFNTSLENAVRLSAYKAGVDSGMSKAAAARLARELTVDFNRKGRTGRELGSLYAFFNASVQGMERNIRTLAGPAGKRVIAGGLAAGALQALMLAAAGFEEDDIPEYVKARAFIIPMGFDKRYIAIPLALGLHVLPNTGRVLTELAMTGGKDAGKKAFEAIGEIAGAFNPLGGGNIFTAHGALTTALPTVLDPIADLSANKNFAGYPIEKEKYSETDNRPGYQRARERTERTPMGQVYLGISKALNILTFGTPYEEGYVSPTPERVRYLAQQVGGGVLREVEKAVDSSVAALRGEDIEPRALPIAGRFVGKVNQDDATRSRYYDEAMRLKKIQSSMRAAKKAGDEAAVEDIVKRHPEIEYADDLARADQQLRKLNAEAGETVDRARLKEIDAERTAIMAGVNEVMVELEKATAKAAATRSESGR